VALPIIHVTNALGLSFSYGGGYPPQGYGPPQGNYGPPQGYNQGPPMQYQQGPPQQVIVREKQDKGCLGAW